ncbi:MAG: SDR family oxidoreductase [Gracilimonas sp.]|nr:SDR family oxidoreductase [Gracilimonas sp.]
MKILIIGANGQIGTRLAHQLIESEHTPVAMVRKEEQVEKFEKDGILTVLADLEEDISHAFKDIDGVVFTAGSGANTPKSQTKVIDEEGAKKAVDEAGNAGVTRFVMVSALMANRDPHMWTDSMQHYYEAKSSADEYLRNSGLDYTVLMPGRLTNEKGTGMVELSKRIEDLKDRSITRDDVASVIVNLLNAKNTINKSLDLLQGDTPVKEAVSKIS